MHDTDEIFDEIKEKLIAVEFFYNPMNNEYNSIGFYLYVNNEYFKLFLVPPQYFEDDKDKVGYVSSSSLYRVYIAEGELSFVKFMNNNEHNYIINILEDFAGKTIEELSFGKLSRF